MASSNLSEKSSSNSSDIQYAASTGTFLVMFILAGTIGNSLIIVSILSSKKLRSSAFHLLSINLAVVNILECLLNMTFNLTTVMSVDTLKGVSTICRVNAFFISVVWIESILGITFMVVERMAAMKNTDKIDVIQRPKRVAIMVAYTWVHSAAFSLPLATGLVSVSIYSDINSCLVSVDASAVYIGTLSVCCFVVPIVVTVILFIVTMKNAFTEKSSVQAQMTRHQYSTDVDEPNFYKEFAGVKFSGIILTSWVFLVAPFVVAIFIYLYRYSDMNLDSGLKLSHSSIMYFLLLWLKYCNVFILPLFSLCYKKEFWLNFKDVLFCKKKNSVNDVANEHNKLSLDSQDKIERLESGEKKIKEEKMKEAFIHNSGFQVPVLFATAQGVHIQTSESEVIVDDQGTVGKKCDVFGSQEKLQQFGEDTSDYDSSNELDPFSVSHPVSTKNLRNQTEPTPLQHRSNSQPEVRSKGQSTHHSTSVTVTSAADSGLDISSMNKSGGHDSSPNLTYDRSVSCPAGETGISHRSFIPTSQKSSAVDKQNKNNTSSRYNDNPTQEPEIFAQMEGCENRAYKVDTADIERCNNSNGQEQTDQTSGQALDKEIRMDRNISDVFEKDGAASGGNTKTINNEIVNSPGDESVDISGVTPATPSKRKKKHKKQTKGSNYTGILRNGSEEMSPPRPPPRLAPLQGCHQPHYQRMTETETAASADVPPNNNSLCETGVIPQKATVYEVKHDRKTRNKTRQRNSDSQSHTSLLDSGSSAELKCLKDSMFGAPESDGYSSQVLEVTTPSACNLVDLSKTLAAFLQVIPKNWTKHKSTNNDSRS
ncbi:uncharacterized protein LOC117339215 [Pecten maximus]|uniref:uncharacterized protein LOC117339215 n=1 Tax=Pecten maximus TaxID=6579 RepID=UPI0014586CF6|nr:uncharacterized protein LOC117339215 [Pecten maximus]